MAQKRLQLKVEKRTVLGKKIKKLRKSGILPANIYGKDIKSQAVQVPYKEFEPIYKEVGETGLIDVAVDGQLRPVLIHNVQLDHFTRQPLHADFFQVNLKEKVKTMVPIELTGEAKAVVDKVGMVLQTLSEVEIEALPTDLPEKIEVNVENLAAVDEQITVGELKVDGDVIILTDPGQVVVKVTKLISKEAEEQAAAEAAAAEAAKAEGAAEGEAPAGAEAKTGKPTEEGAEKPVEGEKKPEEKPAEPESKEAPKQEKPSNKTTI